MAERRCRVRPNACRRYAREAHRRRTRNPRRAHAGDRQAVDGGAAAANREGRAVSGRSDLPPLHLQLAGPAARPNGHPDHAFVTERLAIGEYPTPEDVSWLHATPAFTAVVSLQDDADLDRKGLSL